MADKLARINIVVRLDSEAGAYLTAKKQAGTTYAQAVRDALKIAARHSRDDPSSN